MQGIKVLWFVLETQDSLRSMMWMSWNLERSHKLYGGITFLFVKSKYRKATNYYKKSLYEIFYTKHRSLLVTTFDWKILFPFAVRGSQALWGVKESEDRGNSFWRLPASRIRASLDSSRQLRTLAPISKSVVRPHLGAKRWWLWAMLSGGICASCQGLLSGSWAANATTARHSSSEGRFPAACVGGGRCSTTCNYPWNISCICT